MTSVSMLQIPRQFSKQYWTNHLPFLACLLVFIAINLGLFMQRCVYYMMELDTSSSNFWIIVARANGQCLNFNSTFILVVVLRGCITRLRQLGWGIYLPLDRNIYFHKLTGRIISIQALLHAIAHLGHHCKAFLHSFSLGLNKHGFPLACDVP